VRNHLCAAGTLASWGMPLIEEGLLRYCTIFQNIGALPLPAAYLPNADGAYLGDKVRCTTVSGRLTL